jgi:ABC-type sulfate transport system substrate-binding protein
MAKQEVLLLAKRLDLLRSRLDDAWDATDDRAKRRKLQEQYDDLDRQLMRLISIQVKSNGQAYDAAVEALGKANAALKRALDEEEQFVKAIQAASEALDLVGKVVAIA